MLTPLPDRYWLVNARIPVCLLTESCRAALQPTPGLENLAGFDLKIEDGAIAKVVIAGEAQSDGSQVIALHRGMIWPCFVDMHTHMDKGHIWQRSPNRVGDFGTALSAIEKDRTQFWTEEDIYRRFEFGLKCSYAHGTKAIRTHIDCPERQAEVSLNVFQALRRTWSDRLILQAVSLVSLDRFHGKEGEALADRIAEILGVLGGVAYMNPDIESQIDRVFCLAKERGLDLDFHADENDDPKSHTLLLIAKAALRHEFSGQIACGHCCSLSMQDPDTVNATIDLVKQAGIGIVSLPTCNLYLQDRQPHRTPRWRGITSLQELKTAGVPVALASDNCRDPFYGFGDHDMLQVFTWGTQIAHLDMPYGDWPQAVTSTPAELMGLQNVGQIGIGRPADLVLFKARDFSELLSRPQSDRIVIRNGKAIDTTLPDYAELDDLVGEMTLHI